MKQFFTFLLGIIFSVSLLGQHNVNRCGTMKYLAYQKHNDPTLLARMNSLEKQTQKYIIRLLHCRIVERMIDG